MKILYLECNMGAAGDMLLSALYELLPDREGFLSMLNGLGLPGVRFTPRQVSTCGVAGTRIEVTVRGEEEDAGGSHAADHAHGGGHSHHATPGGIAALIDRLPLPDPVRAHARAVYDAIAAAEAKVHGCGVGDVHFHEVGALDAVADVTGVCYALHLLSPDRIAASPVHVGAGSVRCAHGVMPVPAPATAVLLEGVPAYGGTVMGELCTPTGAALLAHFASSFGPMPLMSLLGTGCGVGKRTFDQANCVRAMLGEAARPDGEEISELVCNLDDMTPEHLAFACARLLEAGALDVYTTPGTMKKGRSGHVLTVLCPPEREADLIRAVFTHTATNGLRAGRRVKYALMSRSEILDTPYGPIRVKRAEGWGAAHAKPEYEDVSAAALRLSLPFQTVWEAVLTQIKEETIHA